MGSAQILSHYTPDCKVWHYSSPPLIRPPYLRTNCGHIREVAFGEREKSIDFIVVRTENSGLIRGVASRESGL